MLRFLSKPLLSTHSRLRVPFSAFAQRSFTTAVPPITPVEKIILDHVKAVGPMSYATYMQFCLAHPTEGYYMKSSNPVFGAQGDFITSPDISQIFGELIAVWLYSQWQAAGTPAKMRLVELGPGRGTLITDVLRVSLINRLPQKPAIEVHLVETSLSLRQIQSKRLSGLTAQPQWYDSIDHILPSDDSFTMLVAHEFFDALPYTRTSSECLSLSIYFITHKRNAQKTEEGWKGDHVTDLEETEKHHPRLQHVLSPEKTAVSTIFGNSSSRFQSLPVGSDLEVSPTSFKLARKVGELLAKRETDAGSTPGGCGLIIDYGNDNAFGNSRRFLHVYILTFSFLARDFKNHQVVDIFHRPGECDLTANVDFAYLKESMQDLVPVYGPMTQKQFLSDMGLMLRLGKLLESAGDDKAKMDRIVEGAQRLVDPGQMGDQYSVLGISANGGGQHPF
ncbi:DUF185-domain-containing protein [Gymnopus androsaceus JB14]|uniref:Protein arginine methyltransferase NDUFAF7 n=1 Tax=Gymnopus androsaceus JB14 TaxID=1447944 RepID=A0A6A4I8Z7_9AGAR|nr:DUF185-domain-containing protein [Gymnopus androsaceus JB14]